MNSDIEPIHTPENTRHQRSIRSYVLRQGRLSNAQERYLNTMMDKIGIAFTPQTLDFAQVFSKQAPCILEIGFGMGETLADVAIANPERNYIGVEVHSPGVGNLCKLIAEQTISNLRLIQHDAVEVLNHMIAPNSLAGVQIFFPDPWPKKRHHKRRLIQAPLVHLLASRLIAGGFIHCATDWQEYAEQMLAVLSAEPLLHNSVADFAPRPASRPLTKFEQRGLGLGHGVWDLFFLRR